MPLAETVNVIMSPGFAVRFCGCAVTVGAEELEAFAEAVEEYLPEAKTMLIPSAGKTVYDRTNDVLTSSAMAFLMREVFI